VTTSRIIAGAFAACVTVASLSAQQPPTSDVPQSTTPSPAAPKPAQASAGVSIAGAVKPPDDYVIGPDDVLTVMFWREKDMSSDVIVRPDGKITLPLINDVQAAGLTTEQLRDKLTAEAARFIEDPSATVVLKQLNSRKVFITGEVSKPGPYVLTAPVTILQLISMAGGLQEFAHRKEIVIMRSENGKQVTIPFDYTAIARKSKPQQNIMLKPGDTIIVP
jgi:polysaccharide export outer membrane protein